MKKAYIDTNIFDYVALKDEKYGSACRSILEDIGRAFEGVCSYLVPIEILGSLSSISPELASEAAKTFFSFDVKLVELSQSVVKDACELTSKTRLSGYDSVHASAAMAAGASTIITENYKDFKRVKGLEVVRPLEYRAWRSGLGQSA